VCTTTCCWTRRQARYEGGIWTYSLCSAGCATADRDGRWGKAVQRPHGLHLFVRSLRYLERARLPDALALQLQWTPGQERRCRASLLEKAFSDTRAGIPGKRRLGRYVQLAHLQTPGIFLVAGQDIYLISSPSVSNRNSLPPCPRRSTRPARFARSL